MISDLTKVSGVDEVRQFVQQSICEQNGLEAAVAPMTERILIRGGKPCGIFFCVQGPRSVTFTAIWDQKQNTVLFYGSAGERRHRATLSSKPKAKASHRGNPPQPIPRVKDV